MSDNVKKGNSFKSLFFKEEEEPEQQTTSTQPNFNSTAKKTNNVSGGGGLLTPIKSVSTPVVVVDSITIETFVSKLQELINQNNQPGFDFLEFTETLFEESQNPTTDVYKMVFRIAQKMDKSLTPDKLIQSAFFYKNLVQQAADGEVSKGSNKKNALQVEKDSERKNLENVQTTANSKIEKLQAQILELQSQSNEAGYQLSAIDQKYNDQFIDIDSKISAITTAKEQVIGSIVDVESGIKNNLR